MAMRRHEPQRVASASPEPIVDEEESPRFLDVTYCAVNSTRHDKASTGIHTGRKLTVQA